ncbi:2-(1,2-epoxy-1,2-dihydrophenyl)acetyl-CoA isomerase [Microbacterium resistens]|uniref:2-(1,2-epoxy-1,2-dihydrophenyl)acetyl-CoA isomerase n=1 Tax=Microbacterium resistens TaxID=156977 RepID=A0ABU1SAK7_9MICO|nr:enoyl-CoA hydratase/isomerase family protein [Microbacterium resistens]MDR6866614.1 2-(1,2-epoxy-1,2-dihydrophenyl)acetyl-CoA isomerase [Microbacterium resistens]
MTDKVLIEDVGAIRLITMNNPGTLNAFDAEMLLGTVEAFDAAGRDDAVRVVVLTGAGRAFCSGGDTGTMGAEVEAGENLGFLTGAVHQVPLAIRRCPRPVIAMVNGPAVGAGLDIALACDLRTVAQGAALLEGYVRAGLAAGDGGAWLLPRLVGTGRALELLLTARRIPADEAVRIGLAASAHEPEELREATLDLAGSIAQHPPRALAAMKNLVHQSQDVSFEVGLQLGASAVAILQDGAEHREAVARLRKRDRA